MKVLLRDGVDKLGERGEIVDVADGYARNFLLPRRLAVPATASNFHQLEIERVRIDKLAVREKEQRLEAVKALEAMSVTIVAPASPEGHLYGSVGEKEIAAALAAEGLDVNDHHVKLEQHIKETGVYVVPVALAPDMVADTRVWVVPE